MPVILIKCVSALDFVRWAGVQVVTATNPIKARICSLSIINVEQMILIICIVLIIFFLGRSFCLTTHIVYITFVGYNPKFHIISMLVIFNILWHDSLKPE
jgi:hypothetical protein